MILFYFGLCAYFLVATATNHLYTIIIVIIEPIPPGKKVTIEKKCLLLFKTTNNPNQNFIPYLRLTLQLRFIAF